MQPMPPQQPRPRPRASLRWLRVVIPLAVLVLALCVALVVQRAGRTTGAGTGPAGSGHTPGTSAPPATELPALALPGARGAVLYLQTATSIIRVDLDHGAVQTASTPQLDRFSSLVAGQGWVISKTVDDPTGVLVRDGGQAQLLPPALQHAGRVYAAGANRIWVLPEEAAGAYRTATLVDSDGDRVGRSAIRVPAAYGVPVGHLRSSLVAVDEDGGTGTYDVATTGPRRLSRGTLLAVGTDVALSWDCDAQRRCDARLNSSGRAPRYLPGARVSLTGLYPDGVEEAAGSDGIVSPDRHWAALELPAPTRSGAWLVLVDLRTGHRIQVPGRLAGTDGNDQAAWSPNSRYLLALAGGRLNVVDTTTGVVSVPDGLPDGLLHLTMPGTSTM